MLGLWVKEVKEEAQLGSHKIVTGKQVQHRNRVNHIVITVCDASWGTENIRGCCVMCMIV